MLILVGRALANVHMHADAERHEAMHQLFTELDIDGDGQIKSAEALHYLKDHWKDGSMGSTCLDSASEEFIQEADGADDGTTVSEAELQAALSKRLQERLCDMP